MSQAKEGPTAAEALAAKTPKGATQGGTPSVAQALAAQISKVGTPVAGKPPAPARSDGKPANVGQWCSAPSSSSPRPAAPPKDDVDDMPPWAKDWPEDEMPDWS